MYQINQLSAEPELLEQLGTKEKFWFRDQNDDTLLFKYSRPNTGEHWSEKVASELCEHLKIPHATYEMAMFNGKYGVYTKNLVPDDHYMSMGNEVLHRDDTTGYPEGAGQRVRLHQHTVSRVLGLLDKLNVKPPLTATDRTITASEYFCGYLMLDTLISNQDRHHENWAVIQNGFNGDMYLCETYDHASSLGRELTHTRCEMMLNTKDRNQTIAAFVAKARSELFKAQLTTKPLLTIEAFQAACERKKHAKFLWLSRLNNLSEAVINEVFEKIPDRIIAAESREVARQMVLENKRRLLCL